jgi:hypothetical protein
MGKIKSALELAMEKTADLKADKSVIQKKDITRKGKISASSYLEEPQKSDLKDQLKSYKGEELEWFRSGAMDTVLANLTLPQVEADLDKLEKLENALILLTGEKKQTAAMFDQLRQLYQQYLSNMDQLEEGLKQQYAPQLRQKEMQLRQQTGQDIHLTPEQDPDFIKLLSEQYGRMEQQYNEVLKQAKDELRKS